MEESKITSRVTRIIRDTLHLQSAAVDPSDNLIRNLGADSLDAVRVQMAIEEEFKIVIPEDVASELNTVGDYIAYVKNRID